MKISNIDTYTTTIFQIENENESYVITHREDGDEYFIPVWIIEDEWGDPIQGELRTQLINIADEYLKNKK